MELVSDTRRRFLRLVRAVGIGGDGEGGATATATLMPTERAGHDDVES